MVGTRSLRSILASALLGPGLLLGAAPSGCDCGSGPRIPETKAVSDCGDPGNEPRARDLTDSAEKIAEKYGYSKQQVRDAIHEVKGRAGLRGKDVLVDVKTGEVYPQTPRGGIGDSVGNIFDYLP